MRQTNQMIVLGIFGWLLLIPVALPAVVFLVEVATGLRRSRAAATAPAAPVAAILMPAHDEAATIGGTIDALRSNLPPSIRLLVVADNCSDDTAAVARAHGAEVVERHDPAARGKGYALDFGRAHLRRQPPACVIVLDADCRPIGDGATRLAAACVRLDAPVQSINLLRADRDAAPMVQISNFAFLVKNLVRQRGLARLGAPAMLGGTGMALPWRLFDRADLANGDLVEDLALGLALVEAGETPRLVQDARVESGASSAGGTLVQRTRWEHGFLLTARRHGLRLLGRAVRQARPGLAWTALHLMVPPLALLMMLSVGTLAVEILLWLVGMPAAPLIACTAMLLALGLAVLACWAGPGRAMLSPATLVRLPLYVLWKLPIYLKFVRRPEQRWVRSDRGD